MIEIGEESISIKVQMVFFEARINIVLGPLRKTLTEDIPPVSPSPICGQLPPTTQLNQS